MNKRGFTVLEVIVGVTILAILVIITTNAQSYVATHSSKIVKKETYFSHIEAELTDIYYHNTIYDEKTIDTNVGELIVTMEDLGLNEYNNDVSKVTFTANDFSKTYEVERSRYYVE